MDDQETHRRTVRFQNVPGEAHYLTISCFQERSFLSRDRTRQYVIDALEKARERFHFHLWAYVIMPNHVHLLLFPLEEEYNMGKIETALKLSVLRRALHYLRTHNPDGLRLLETGQHDTPHRFWQQGNGYDVNVESREAAYEIGQYVHNNPVRAGLCEEPEDWFWSSAAEWKEAGSGPLRVDRESLD